MSVQKYRGIVGAHVRLKEARTPSLPEEAKNHPARMPYTGGKSVECTWCKHSFNPDVPFDSKKDDDPGIGQGELAPHAASV